MSAVLIDMMATAVSELSRSLGTRATTGIASGRRGSTMMVLAETEELFEAFAH